MSIAWAAADLIRHGVRLLCLVLAVAGMLGSSPAHAACQVDQRTVVSLSVLGRSIIVPVEVNGIAAAFILDTGAQRSVVVEEAIARLGLARDQWVGTTMRGLGGVNSRANADPRSLSLGGVPLVRRTLNHDTSLVVGMLPAGTSDGRIDGMLGRDYLSLFDLDLDIPARQLTLYQPTGCAGRFLPWLGNYAEIPVINPMENALVLPVQLDGQPMSALLDSGADSSFVGAPGIFKLQMTDTELSGDPAVPVAGLGAHVVMMRQHRFHSLQVGGQSTVAPLIWVAPVHITPIVDMVLGADWLAERRVWISYATRRLFVATP